MSSELLPPDGLLPVEPVAWVLVGAGAGEAAAASGGEPEAAAAAERLAELERECARQVQAAREAGVREGEAAGRERAAAETRKVLEDLARALQETAALKPRLRREAEADLIRLALAIARRVLHRELAMDPDAMRGVAIAALEKLRGREISQVRVHPNLAPMLTDALRRTVADQALEVVADPAREPGTLIFETLRGNLDVSVDSQLREIENGLADRLRRAG